MCIQHRLVQGMKLNNILYLCSFINSSFTSINYVTLAAQTYWSIPLDSEHSLRSMQSLFVCTKLRHSQRSPSEVRRSSQDRTPPSIQALLSVSDLDSRLSRRTFSFHHTVGGPQSLMSELYSHIPGASPASGQLAGYYQYCEQLYASFAYSN